RPVVPGRTWPGFAGDSAQPFTRVAGCRRRRSGETVRAVAARGHRHAGTLAEPADCRVVADAGGGCEQSLCARAPDPAGGTTARAARGRAERWLGVPRRVDAGIGG